MRSLKINTLRQLRAITVLLESEYVRVSEMRSLIGAQNPAQIILELRKGGFWGIIQTRLFNQVDHDGKKCRSGEYYIPKELKPEIKICMDGLRSVHSEYQKSKHTSTSYNHDKGGL